MVITNSVDYVRWTQTTAIYLDKVETEREARLYELFGVIDEVGEIAGMLKRQIRDNNPLDHRALGLELGDLAWYLARIHYNHADSELDTENGAYPLVKELGWLEKVKGLTCFDIAFKISEHLKKHFMTKDAAAKFMFGPRPKDLVEMIRQAHHGFTREDAVGQFVTSMYRRIASDSEGSVETAGILMHLVGEAHSMEAVFDWLSFCYRFNYEPLEVLQNNVIKLESRKERGTLHGKGSER